MNPTQRAALGGLVAFGLFAASCSDDKKKKSSDDGANKPGEESCLTDCEEGGSKSGAKSGSKSGAKSGSKSGTSGDDDDDDNGNATGKKDDAGGKDSPPADPPQTAPAVPLRTFNNNGFAAGVGDGGGPVYAPFNGAAKVVDRFMFDASFRFGVRVAAGDFDGDSNIDYAGGLGKGAGPVVRVHKTDGSVMVGDFFAFEESFRGGVFLAACDLDGDKKDELLVGAGEGGGPIVKVFKLGNGMQPAGAVSAFDPNARLGAVPGCGDVNGDGKAEVFVTAGPGGGPRIQIWQWNGGSPAIIKDFFGGAAESFRGGLVTAGGDVNGDGHADVIVVPGDGGGPVVTIFSGKDFSEMKAFLAYEDTLRCGLRVTAFHQSNDVANASIAVVPGPGCSARVKVFTLENNEPQVKYDQILADPNLRFGGFVGGVARR